MMNNENNHFDDTNTIIELSPVKEDTLFEEDLPKTTIKESEIKISPKKPKIHLTKKQIQIIVIVIMAIVVITLATGIYFIFRKDKPVANVVPNEPMAIEKDNYIYDNGILKLLNKDDQEIGTYECVNKEAEKCYVAFFDNEDEFDTPRYLNEQGELLNRRIPIYHDRYVFIYDNNKVNLYDLTDKTILKELKLVKNGSIDSNHLAVRNLSNDYAIIEITENEVKEITKFNYDYLGIINSNESFVVKDAMDSYLIDNTGKAITSKVKGDIKNFNAQYLIVKDSKYQVLDYSGHVVLNDKYDYIEFYNNYLIAINNKNMYIYNSDLIKLNEEAIKLNTSNYLKQYIFNDQNSLKEVKKAYAISEDDQNIIINVDEKNETVNKYEGVINSKINYLNYYDGTIYIYSDSAKTSLMGTYKCSTKNTVTSVESEYSSCFIAKDSNIVNTNNNSYIPIINNQYLFINDNQYIYLYDFINSKKLVKYKAVDSGLGLDHINKVKTLNSPIVAQNENGYYGVIKFGTNGPESIIKFKEDNQDTDHISLLKDCYIVHRGDQNYLYTKNGVLKGRTSFTIVDYLNDYMVVKDQNYLVYNMNGTIVSDALNDIKLYNNFYLGVKDNILNVYLYQNSKVGAIANGIDVTGATYDLAINKDNYIVTITKNEETQKYIYDLNWKLVSPVTGDTENPTLPGGEINEEE